MLTSTCGVAVMMETVFSKPVLTTTSVALLTSTCGMAVMVKAVFGELVSMTASVELWCRRAAWP